MKGKRVAIGGVAALLMTGLLLAVPAPIDAQARRTLTGRWSVRDPVTNQVQFLFRVSGGETTSTPIPISELRGLTMDPGAGPNDTATFELSRDAGVVRFTGSLRRTGGAGTFTFHPNADYVDGLRGLGLPALTGPDETFRMAVLDVSVEFARQLYEQGGRPRTLDQLRSMRIHGVGGEYLRQLRELGYSNLSPDVLISMRIHRVTGNFIAQLRALGYASVSPQELTSLMTHGVTIQFIDALAALGYRQLPIDDLISLGVHRITAADIRRLQIAGTPSLTVDDIIDAKLAAPRR